jgi:hypothetical protein
MTNNNTEKFEVTHLSDNNGSMDSIITKTITDNKYIHNIYKSSYRNIEDLQLQRNSSIGMSSSSQILKHFIESESKDGVE